ncbi:prepilin-type N-terminal cleavage/methylation domain-containing protein [Thermus sediminis]|uniref:prepilin-type N-terminal cleavage/methylation domain-containing protein n=1 Tax=Thermus sediminis TaxID=1761908 RepID=UPI000E3E02ED|nr:prepilin-type N-terminal cleavage/methylation domain-containing protein [Thermus sediminis]
MKKGFSLLELLVALAVFGLLSAAILGGLLGVFQVNRGASLEARAVVVAKDYLERARRESTYNNALRLPPLGQTAGFSVALAAAGRLDPTQPLSFAPCAGDPSSGYTCTVACSPGPCRLVAVRLTLEGGGRTYTFYREWPL